MIMPEIKIKVTSGERERLNKKLIELWECATNPMGKKDNLINRIHDQFEKAVTEAYEIGKEVGETDLD